VPSNALVSGGLEPRSFAGFGKLGTLVVADVWKPAGSSSPSGDVYRLRDSGVRCIRAPCFWLLDARLNSSRHGTVSDLDLTATGASPSERTRAEVALRTSTGLLAAGHITRTADGGRVFRATTLFFRVARPRG
jgi:hypothetical protein